MILIYGRFNPCWLGRMLKNCIRLERILRIFLIEGITWNRNPLSKSLSEPKIILVCLKRWRSPIKNNRKDSTNFPIFWEISISMPEERVAKHELNRHYITTYTQLIFRIFDLACQCRLWDFMLMQLEFKEVLMNFTCWIDQRNQGDIFPGERNTPLNSFILSRWTFLRIFLFFSY